MEIYNGSDVELKDEINKYFPRDRGWKDVERPWFVMLCSAKHLLLCLVA